MLGTVANGLILNTWNDPFDIPLTTPQTVHEPNFHYYLYDPPRSRGRHLGNTRIVYMTTLPSCGNPEYTLEAVMNYFPYACPEISGEKHFVSLLKRLRSM